MKTKPIFLFPVVLAAISAVSYGSYRVGLKQHLEQTSAAIPTGTAVDTATGRTVLYWHDPMVPGQRFDKPGKSPFMDMALVPVYADEGSDSGNVSINSRVQQNLGIRTAEVTKGSLLPNIEAVGSVVYNERDLILVQARANGYVEKLNIRATLDSVHKGQTLAELYVPDWVAAQEDFLTAKRLAAQGGDVAGMDLVDAARQRMRLAGMSEAQMQLVESAGKVQARMIIVSPVDGVVSELDAREGMTIVSGAPLFRINGLGTVWVNAEVPESAAALVRIGNVVEVRTPALSGIVLKGKVGAVLPDVNSATRTLKARIELTNSGLQLVPGMFATVNFSSDERKDMLLVPSEAVIQTGKRSVVIVAQADGRFAPMDIETGSESNGQTEIRKGLELGQKVIVSGQFLIDSEASLRGVTQRMNDAPVPAGNTAATHHGSGRVEAIDKNEVTLSHGPIPSLQWGAMTMSFKLPVNGLPQGIKIGDRVDFEIKPISDGAFEIVSIAPMTGAKP
ncbi:MAG: efflux RND transporter periplasmic adaptor subunit [Nitrosomonadales bacterium]